MDGTADTPPGAGKEGQLPESTSVMGQDGAQEEHSRRQRAGQRHAWWVWLHQSTDSGLLWWREVLWLEKLLLPVHPPRVQVAFHLFFFFPRLLFFPQRAPRWHFPFGDPPGTSAIRASIHPSIHPASRLVSHRHWTAPGDSIISRSGPTGHVKPTQARLLAEGGDNRAPLRL